MNITNLIEFDAITQETYPCIMPRVFTCRVLEDILRRVVSHHNGFGYAGKRIFTHSKVDMVLKSWDSRGNLEFVELSKSIYNVE